MSRASLDRLPLVDQDVRTFLYPWFEPRPLSQAILAEAHTRPSGARIVIGRAGFNVNCRAVITATLGDLREFPVRAPTRITAGQMHYLHLALFEHDERGEIYPDGVEFALWAPGSKNKAPDHTFRLPIKVRSFTE